MSLELLDMTDLLEFEEKVKTLVSTPGEFSVTQEDVDQLLRSCDINVAVFRLKVVIQNVDKLSREQLLEELKGIQTMLSR